MQVIGKISSLCTPRRCSYASWRSVLLLFAISVMLGFCESASSSSSEGHDSQNVQIPSTVTSDLHTLLKLTEGEVEVKIDRSALYTTDGRWNIVIHNQKRKIMSTKAESEESVLRRVNRIGSSPPSCEDRCGVCDPCIRVIVPIRSSSAFRNEYYPEVWRCLCDDQHYDP